MRLRTLHVCALLLFTFFVTPAAWSQTEYKFDQGLAISQVHRYGREAIVTDQLAYMLSKGNIPKPRAGAALFRNKESVDVSWEEIKTDSTGKFRGEAIMNGYVYLTYNAKTAGPAVLNVTGNIMLYFNREPRGGDIYSDGWMYIPVTLKKGLNEILIRCGNFSRWQGVGARLFFPGNPVALSAEDATLPHIIIGKTNETSLGAVVIVNTTDKTISDLVITATLNGKSITSNVADIAANTIRKEKFLFDGRNISAKGDNECLLQLTRKGKLLDEKTFTVSAVEETDHHSYTFESNIDGSVQYYSVAPQQKTQDRPALFLSVHGAGVQAIGQARAYAPKDWGVLVAPTNRRPRGFNWEDWGRIDALEVLELATKRFNPDPERIYLTGHSMGGHGTWYLGATYPDKWAAIAPCAGYPTLTAYGSADGRIPDSARSEQEKTLLRASNASNVIALATNYKHHGVYIFHGDDDRVVPVAFARQMRGMLADFHPDFSYYEYPGGSHWFGNESVDWPPLFNYFRWHTLKHDSVTDNIDFVTANPAISSECRWAAITQQIQPLDFSKISLVRNKQAKTITGTTVNVGRLTMDLSDFKKGDHVSITLDSSVFGHVVEADRQLYFTRLPSGWDLGPKPDLNREKNVMRSGTFKEAFNHRMVFVYGTEGNAEENRWAYNKARYDAEVWYYRANGSVDIIPDHAFDPGKFPDRGVVLYGNAVTNSAWNRLLTTCPIQVTRGRIISGSQVFTGDDLAAYFIWPRGDSNIASVAVIAGTGITGMHAAEANQYFAAGSGFPDYVIFSAEMLKSGAEGIKATGFYTNKWTLPPK